jgi:hypothetical protein
MTKARIEFLRTVVVTLNDGREVRLTVQVKNGHKRSVPESDVAQAARDAEAVVALINQTLVRASRITPDTERPSCPNVPRRDGTFTTEHESGFYCDVCGDITV